MLKGLLLSTEKLTVYDIFLQRFPFGSTTGLPSVNWLTGL